MRELLLLMQIKVGQVVCQAQLAKAMQAAKELEALRIAAFIEAGKCIRAVERQEKHHLSVAKARAKPDAELEAKRQAYLRAHPGRCRARMYRVGAEKTFHPTSFLSSQPNLRPRRPPVIYWRFREAKMGTFEENFFSSRINKSQVKQPHCN